jgi:internalin A
MISCLPIFESRFSSSLLMALLLASLPTTASRGEQGEPLSIHVLCEDQVDLKSFRGKPVENVNLWKSNIRDLSPLAGMPIKTLVIFGCPVKDLSPLADMPLESAWVGATEARDFSPLKGAPLRDLNLSPSAVTDLSFVRGMPLKSLKLSATGEGRITDLTPLDGMELEELEFEASTVTKGMDILRAMKSLKQINYHEVKEFWESYDAGRFDDIQLPTWMFGWK